MRKSKQLFTMRRLLSNTRDIRADYARMASALQSLESDVWTVNATRLPKIKKITGEFVFCVDLSNSITPKAKCQLDYHLPDPDAPDNQSADDHLSFEFTGNEDAYKAFVDDVLQRLVVSFNPYRAHLGPSSLVITDFNIARTKNWHYDVYRIYPVDYLSKALIKSAFNKSPQQFCSAIQSSCERAAVFHKGVVVSHCNMFSEEQ